MSDAKILSGKRILLVDDDASLRLSVSKLLQSMGALIFQAENGNSAQNLIGLEALDLVISDIKMPGCNGIELLHFVKRTMPALPVVLMTGFSELKETKEAYELGAKGFIAKPFSRDELRDAVVACVGAAPPAPAENQDDDYSKLSIEDFVTGKQIKFDIFIRLAKDKFVKIANEGEDLAVERIRAYRSKGILFLHMRKSDFARYVGLNVEIAKRLQESPNISAEKKLNFIKHTGEILLERYFLEEITPEAFAAGKSAVETSISLLFESPDMAALLESLNQSPNHLYAHSVGVSFYAAMIARAMRWENPRNLYKLSMAGMLHDIGKKGFPPELLEKSRASQTAEDKALYETHPTAGAAILSELREIPGDIVQIVQQHHENCLGTGWPAHLTKAHIHPMARVISLANELCHLILKTPKAPALPIREALDRIYIYRSKEFDQEALNALLSIFSPEVIKRIQNGA